MQWRNPTSDFYDVLIATDFCSSQNHHHEPLIRIFLSLSLYISHIEKREYSSANTQRNTYKTEVTVKEIVKNGAYDIIYALSKGNTVSIYSENFLDCFRSLFEKILIRISPVILVEVNSFNSKIIFNKNIFATVW